MSTISINSPDLLKVSSSGARRHRENRSVTASWTVNIESRSSNRSKTEDFRLQLQVKSTPQHGILKSSNFQFDRLQTLEQDLFPQNKHEFGQYEAREAVLDEEYWTAAWLRAESRWENQTDERYVENYKRKFAEQEFTAIKRRCREQFGQKCICIVTVRKEHPQVKHTILRSVVGTLDLSIQCLLQGETFPGEKVRFPLFHQIGRAGPSRYGYIANMCVLKSARRTGIASNMLHFALELAKSTGVDRVYIHVHRHNRPAQDLYEKMGFQMVEKATPQLREERTYLLCVEM